MGICIVTIVDSIAATSMPVNEFVLYRSRNKYKYRQVLISCSSNIPDAVVIPSDISVHLVGNNRKMMRQVLLDNKAECRKHNEGIVIHLHAQKSAIQFFLASIGLGLRKRTIFTIHSTYNSRDIRYKVSSCLCSLFSRYANCVSHAAYMEYSGTVKRLKGHKMFAIQNGVDFERIQSVINDLPNHSNVADIFKLVCVGRMIPIKNQQFLVRILKNLPETKLILIGQEDETIKALIKKIGVEDRVTITGLIPRDEVFRTINECGIYVSASLVEGMPVSVLEAMSVGLIPVLSDIAPHKEVAKSCLLFNVLPLDEKDWIQTIQTYQQLDKQEIKGLSLQIKYSVKHNFSLEAMHAQYNEIYKIIAK